MELKFIQTRAVGSDETAPYDVQLDGDYTLGEFVGHVLNNHTRDWGYIDPIAPPVQNPKPEDIFSRCRIEYRYGKIVSGEIAENLRALHIDHVKAAGGWSRMDYIVTLK